MMASEENREEQQFTLAFGMQSVQPDDQL